MKREPHDQQYGGWFRNGRCRPRPPRHFWVAEPRPPFGVVLGVDCTGCIDLVLERPALAPEDVIGRIHLAVSVVVAWYPFRNLCNEPEIVDLVDLAPSVSLEIPMRKKLLLASNPVVLRVSVLSAIDEIFQRDLNSRRGRIVGVGDIDAVPKRLVN